MYLLLKLYLLFTIVCVARTKNSTDDEVEYLTNLFTENTVLYNEYKVPQNNEDLIGTTSDQIIDYGGFDFIIVGAGTAGSVLAGRLSKQLPMWRFLLLEAGDEATEFSKIPGTVAYLPNSKMNWGYFSTPQTTACLGMKNHQCPYPRGKAMGGSGAINNLVYTRGNTEDYDDWVKMGNKGWNSQEVMGYFKLLERWETEGDPGYHDTFYNDDDIDHKFTCSVPTPESNKFPYVIKALNEKNVSEVDYNGRTQLGCSKIVFNVDFNKRVSLAKAYLTDPPSNLNISKHSYVTKLILNSTKAEGIYFVKNNVTYKAYAKRELILSAGSINTPQILMLSGIGPKKELKKHGIKVVKNLPVGQNLQEHVVTFGVYMSTNMTEATMNLTEQLQNYVKGLKPLTAAAPEIISFLQVNKKNNTQPDIELVLDSSQPLGDYSLFNGTNEKVFKFLSDASNMNAIGTYMWLMHPKSRGSVTLKSKDPKDFPNVDLNMLSDENDTDINTFYLSYKFLEGLMETSAMKQINATILKPTTFCQEHEISSKNYWYCVFRHTTQVGFHPVGTTRMGQDEKTSVVTSQLKVHGIQNLRVIDAGVMPETISGHTNAPTAMIALRMSKNIMLEYMQEALKESQNNPQ